MWNAHSAVWYVTKRGFKGQAKRFEHSEFVLGSIHSRFLMA